MFPDNEILECLFARRALIILGNFPGKPEKCQSVYDQMLFECKRKGEKPPFLHSMVPRNRRELRHARKQAFRIFNGVCYN